MTLQRAITAKTKVTSANGLGGLAEKPAGYWRIPSGQPGKTRMAIQRKGERRQHEDYERQRFGRPRENNCWRLTEDALWTARETGMALQRDGDRHQFDNYDRQRFGQPGKTKCRRLTKDAHWTRERDGTPKGDAKSKMRSANALGGPPRTIKD